MPPLERVYQIAFVVAALEPACLRWARQARAGPFFLFDPMPFVEPWPEDPGIAIALGFSGDTLVELIEVRGEGGPVFGGAACGALHHIARMVLDVGAAAAALEADGAPTAFRARFHPDTRMAFADTRASLGCWTELIEATPAIGDALAMLRAAHDGWDGSDPVRRL